MLYSYNTTLAAANSSAILFTTASGKETLVVGARINGGSSGGVVTLVKNDGNSSVFSEEYALDAGDVLSLDSKIAFPAGWSWRIISTNAGVSIDVCADVVGV